MWRRSKGTPLRILVDALVPLDELRRAVYSMECSEYDVPVALVKWQHVSLRHNLQVLYETLAGHGLPTFPGRQEALRGWDDLHSRVERMDLVADESVRPPPSEAMTLVAPDGQLAYQSDIPRQVTDLGELVDLSEEEPMLNHLWFVNQCKFPKDALSRHHATLSMDMCDRMSQLHPRPAVRAYTLNGVSLPLLLWYRSQQTRVIPMVQEYLHLIVPVHRSMRGNATSLPQRGTNLAVFPDTPRHTGEFGGPPVPRCRDSP